MWLLFMHRLMISNVTLKITAIFSQNRYCYALYSGEFGCLGIFVSSVTSYIVNMGSNGKVIFIL